MLLDPPCDWFSLDYASKPQATDAIQPGDARKGSADNPFGNLDKTREAGYFKLCLVLHDID